MDYIGAIAALIGGLLAFCSISKCESNVLGVRGWLVTTIISALVTLAISVLVIHGNMDFWPRIIEVGAFIAYLLTLAVCAINLKKAKK